MSLNDLSLEDMLVLSVAYEEPFTLKSDFARKYTYNVAKLVSTGLITTQLPSGVYGNKWRITVAGLEVVTKWFKGED